MYIKYLINRFFFSFVLFKVCYVSNEGSVFGASVPFQIRINNEELTFAIEEDMVVVKSSNDLAKEKLLKVNKSSNKKKILSPMFKEK